MDWKDLCSVAEVCPRLGLLAAEVFASKWQNFELVANGEHSSNTVLQHFGDHIRTLCIKSANLPVSSNLVNSLMSHCDALVNLEIHRMSINWSIKLLEINCRLRKLILKNCMISIPWIVTFNALTDLALINTRIEGGIKTCKAWPHLTKLRVNDEQDWTKDGFIEFTDRMELKDDRNIQNGIDVRTAITCDTINNFESDGVEDLEIVSYLFEYCYKARISKLTKLKRLQIYTFTARQSKHLLAEIKGLPQLSELVVGCLRCLWSVNYLMDIIQSAANLQLMILALSVNPNAALQINQHIYNQMLLVVLRRSCTKPLHIVIIGDEDDLDEIDVDFLMHSALKITCLSAQAVYSVLNGGEAPPNSSIIMKYTSADVKLLRERLSF